jgi:OCT family organic cation transporter-like MFS transporter 4/5
LIYFGLTLGAGQLVGDPFLNATLMATVELIAVLCSEYAYKIIGRKIPYVVNMSIAGVILLVVFFVPKCISLISIIILFIIALVWH